MAVPSEFELKWRLFADQADWEKERPSDILAALELIDQLLKHDRFVLDSDMPALLGPIRTKTHLGKRICALAGWASGLLNANECTEYMNGATN